MEIIKNGIIQVPLYHGTSTLFTKSIAQKGLGADLAIYNYDILEFCKEIYTLSEEHLKHTSLWKNSSFSFKAMVEQRSDGMDFSHNRLFLTGSLTKAYSYSSSDYGSEIISYSIKFLKSLIEYKFEQKLLNKDIEYNFEKKFPNHIFSKLLKNKYCPVIIKIINLPIDLVCKEDNNIEIFIQNLKRGYDFNEGCQESREVYRQGIIVKLKEIIPTENLTYFLIDSIEKNPIVINGIKFNPLIDIIPIDIN